LNYRSGEIRTMPRIFARKKFSKKMEFITLLMGCENVFKLNGKRYLKKRPFQTDRKLQQ
jgi:hypothetical protein